MIAFLHATRWSWCAVSRLAAPALTLVVGSAPLLSFAAESTGAKAMSPRAKARLIGVVVPDFPKDLAPGGSREVAVRFRVGAGGQVDDVEVTSPPSSMDADVAKSVRTWFVVPAVCSDSAWSASEIRTTLSFSREGDSKFVTVKDPRWYAVGEQVELRKIDESTQSGRLLRISGDDPVYPRSVIRRGGIEHGIVVAQMRIDVGGSVVGIPRLFSWPGLVFEETTRSALMQWKLGNADGTPIDKPFLSCVEVSFYLPR